MLAYDELLPVLFISVYIIVISFWCFEHPELYISVFASQIIINMLIKKWMKQAKPNSSNPISLLKPNR